VFNLYTLHKHVYMSVIGRLFTTGVSNFHLCLLDVYTHLIKRILLNAASNECVRNLCDSWFI